MIPRTGRLVLSSVLCPALASLALVAAPTPASAAPSNDDFANASVIAATGGPKAGSNVGATVETGEPNHAASPYGEAFHSIWYSWTAPEDGPARVSTCGSAFDTRVGVYTGDALATLHETNSNDNSTSGDCPGTAFAEVQWSAVAGTTYRIAVDTNGGIDENDQPEQNSQTTGAVSLVLEGPGEVDPGITEPTVEVTVPDFRPACRTQGTAPEKCAQDRLRFRRLGTVEDWVEEVRAEGGDVRLVTAGKFSGTQDGSVLKYLRAPKGRGDEVLQQNVKPGTTFFTTVDEPVLLKIGYFSKAEDQAIQEATLAALEKAGDGNKNVKSPCDYIDTDANRQKILVELNEDLGQPGYLNEAEAGAMFAKKGCGYEVSEYFDVPGISEDAVWEVTGIDAKRHLVRLKVGLPVSQDFLLVIREDPQFATPTMLGLGTDGRLTASDHQQSRITVQVVERVTGRLVAGAKVTFVGTDGKSETQATNSQGEWTFTSLLPRPGRFAIKAQVKGANGATMNGYRSVDVVDRGTGSFVTMSGRTMTYAAGDWVGTQEDVDRARSLPVVPANLGTGISGAPTAAPQVVQATAAHPNSNGTWTAGATNSVSIPDDSNFAVGAAPGLVVIGGGLEAQVGRSALRAWPNPFQAVADAVNYVCTGLSKAFQQNKGTLADRTTPAQQQAVSNAAQVLAANGAATPSSSLISDKGLGLISDKGLGVISTGGLNVISTGGLNLVDGNGNPLIGQAGGNVIATGGGNVISTGGLNVISTGGLNLTPVPGGALIGQAGGN